MDGDFVPRDGEMERLLLPAPAYIDRDTGPLFSAQLLEHPGVGADFPDRNAVINADDLVTGPDAHPFGRAALDRFHHYDGVLHDLELHADAVEIALQRLVHAAHLLFWDIDRMRIKLLQHLDDGLVGKFFKIGGIHVIIPDILHQPVNLLRVDLVIAVLLGIHRAAQQKAGRNACTTGKVFEQEFTHLLFYEKKGTEIKWKTIRVRTNSTTAQPIIRMPATWLIRCTTVSDNAFVSLLAK